MAAIIATQPLLDDARAKYHALVTGTSARVVVDQNGERVEFTAAKRQDLYNYITELEAALSAGTAPIDNSRYHPATFVF